MNGLQNLAAATPNHQQYIPALQQHQQPCMMHLHRQGAQLKRVPTAQNPLVTAQ